jgi:hypothetical protein
MKEAEKRKWSERPYPQRPDVPRCKAEHPKATPGRCLEAIRREEWLKARHDGR